jgi:hypothetical protein
MRDALVSALEAVVKTHQLLDSYQSNRSRGVAPPSSVRSEEVARGRSPSRSQKAQQPLTQTCSG